MLDFASPGVASDGIVDGGRVPFTEAELAAMRGGLTAEEYRLKFIRKWGASRA